MNHHPSIHPTPRDLVRVGRFAEKRRWSLALGVLCFLLTSTPVIASANPLPPQKQRATPTPAVAVAATGNDSTCTRGNLRRPCATFGAAFRIARCGDVVEVASGRYGFQRIAAEEKRNCSAYVTFRAAKGAPVAITSAGNGVSGGCGGGNEAGCFALSIDEGTSWLRLTKIAIQGDFAVSHTDHVSLVDDTGGGALIRDSTNFEMIGGSYGPCQSPHTVPHTTYCSGNWTFDGDGRTTASLRGVTIHDFTLSGGDHFECMRVYRVKTLLISGARIFNCMIYGISFQYGGVPTSVVVEKSWFGPTLTGQREQRGSSVEFSSEGVPFENTTIRRNSFTRGEGITVESGTFGRNVAAVKNILGVGRGSCISGVDYRHNLSPGSACDGDGNTSTLPFGYALQAGRLLPDGSRASAVRKAFAYALHKHTPLTKIAKWMQKAHMPAPAGRRWSAQALKRVLVDSSYVGSLYGPPAAHPALVTRKAWSSVCERAALRARCSASSRARDLERKN